jgi:hypothetical protein
VKNHIQNRGIAVNSPSRARYDATCFVLGALIAVALALELVALTAWVMA